LWTIPVELQFYFVLPVIYFLARKLKGTRKQNMLFFAVFCAFVITSFIILRIFPDVLGISSADNQPLFQKLLRYTFIPNFFMFMLGVVLQRLQLYKSPLIYGKAVLWLALYLVISWFVPYNAYTVLPLRILLGFCALSMAYTRPALSGKILKGNDISYGVYIYHGLFVNIFYQLNLFNKGIYLLYIFMASYITGYLSWIFIEKNFIRKKKQTIHAVA
jgi:peptidoglycan/LPS O-acetylase OafA/YrhL